MKIYLASFLEEHNFNPDGRVIGICNGDKPDFIDVKLVFLPFVPANDLITYYRNNRDKDPVSAAKKFKSDFGQQLDDFYQEVMEACEKENKTPQDILPFEDGDTLASWERADFTNHRRMVAPILEKLGYDVVKN